MINSSLVLLLVILSVSVFTSDIFSPHQLKSMHKTLSNRFIILGFWSPLLSVAHGLKGAREEQWRPLGKSMTKMDLE